MKRKVRLLTDGDALSEENMPSWRDRLYQSYVSSGQASGTGAEPFRIQDFPYQNSCVRPLLPSNRNARILDLGCGNGPLLFCLKSWGYTNVAGVDVSQQQVELAHAKGVPEVVCGDVYQFLDEQTEPVDVVFLMDVIEHLTREELFQLLDAVHESMAPGGTVIMHLPNALGIFGMSILHGDLTHEQAFAPRSINQLLTTCGFSQIDIREDKPVVHGVKSLLRRLVWGFLTAPVRLLYLAETGHLPKALSKNLLITARKPNSA